ncbi:MAG: hypothetical protein ACSHWN_10115 [Methylophilaceae bacterium]
MGKPSEAQKKFFEAIKAYIDKCIEKRTSEAVEAAFQLQERKMKQYVNKKIRELKQ